MCPEMFFYDPSEIQIELGLFPVPAFWDDELVSIALSLPTNLKLRQGKSKYILRKAASQKVDRRYWMMSKIGLQNSFSYVAQSEFGSDWLSDLQKRIDIMMEYDILRGIVPDGKVDANRLINLLVWKDKNDLTQ